MATNLGKIKRVEKIRNIIFDEMMEGLMDKDLNSHIFLDREILFYTLLEHGLKQDEANLLATKIYGEGKQIVSNGLKDIFSEEKNGLGRNQITKFIGRYMNSKRVELIKEIPYTWRMNGFSTFESPYIAGYSNLLYEKEQELKKQKRKEQELFRIKQEEIEMKKIEKRITIKKHNDYLREINQELNSIKNQIENGKIEPEIIRRRNDLMKKKSQLNYKLIYEV